MKHHAAVPGEWFELLVVVLGALLICIYYFLERNRIDWLSYRILLWATGVSFAVISLAGPIAEQAHADFSMHMTVHLLLGMLSPLFLVLAKPAELIIKTLPVKAARKLTGWMKSSRYLQLIHMPAVGAILNIGGLFLLYRTGLFSLMHESLPVYLLVHLHVFLAGYLFTHLILAVDFVPRRYSFFHRATVLVLTLAAHKILSKVIYASPPEGIEKAAGEQGAMLMYYGGDLIDLAIIILICYGWYRNRQRKYAFSTG
ncbi:cytochrome c oxidase assembly protein [Jeotgalibacillus haloalkalitolerans]|uniref:Cytochrome c oxidase assembly protein n=1 Tax=Jeotgalibacillus haloalkalitolerans TaxID=3104292 RepID=A0ABU5KJA7_9BACL|nr:cytochrome c oxidase assembly protein [Jeotgalibacillus sp. HH7-29]MDZ5710805.1 cytochrome c oxidase assembly protein [Jeotgalibacillus sp. HH7-29]